MLIEKIKNYYENNKLNASFELKENELWIVLPNNCIIRIIEYNDSNQSKCNIIKNELVVSISINAPFGFETNIPISLEFEKIISIIFQIYNKTINNNNNQSYYKTYTHQIYRYFNLFFNLNEYNKKLFNINDEQYIFN